MDNITFRTANITDKIGVYNVLVTSYFPDMPLFAACNMTEPPDIESWAAVQELGNEISVVAVDHQERIIGVAINVIPKEHSEPKRDNTYLPLDKFLNIVDKNSKGLLSNLEKTTMELSILSVVKEHRAKGISKRLIGETEKLARSIGQKKLFALTTNAFMAAAFRRQHWDIIYQYDFTEHKKVDPDFKVPPLPHSYFTFFQKEI